MNEQIDESIPVLTEIISDSDGKPANLAPKVQESHFPVSAQTSTTDKETPIASTIKPVNAAIAAAKEVLAQITEIPATELQAEATNKEVAPTMSAEQWKELEVSVRENVLRQVLSRVDFVLEHRVSDSLAEVLQTAVDKLADEIRVGLRNSIEEVVKRAVTQELSKISNGVRKS